MDESSVRRTSRSDPRWWVALAATAGVVLGVFIGPALAASPAPGQVTTEAREHTISVSGVGKVFVTPDVADVSLGVQVQRQSVEAARDEAARIMNSIISALKALGIADADIRTTMLDVSPMYDYSVEGAQRVTGYQVTNIVTVHVRELDKLAAVIDDSVAAGATTVNSVAFSLADPSNAERQAREAAVADARGRADTLAAAAGVTITGVASISESYSAPWTWYGPDRSNTDGAAPTPVMPGTSEVSITVSVEYLIQ